MKLNCLLFTLIVLTLVTSACTPTIVNESWKDEKFSAPLGKVMVLGVSENKTARRAFEQKLVSLFEQQGVSAVASYQLLPGDEKLTKETVAETARSNAVQSILVSRVASIKRIKETRSHVTGSAYYGPSYHNTYYPSRYAYNNDWYDYYGRHYSDAFTVSTRDYEWKLIKTENNFYNLSSKQMFWSAILESESDRMDKTIDSITSTLVKQMKKDGVL